MLASTLMKKMDLGDCETDNDDSCNIVTDDKRTLSAYTSFPNSTNVLHPQTEVHETPSDWYYMSNASQHERSLLQSPQERDNSFVNFPNDNNFSMSYSEEMGGSYYNNLGISCSGDMRGSYDNNDMLGFDERY